MGFAEVVKPSDVGFGEAENASALAGSQVVATSPEQRRKRLIRTENYTLKEVLPEQGSWHFARKQRILSVHPEIEALFGYNPWSAALLAVVLVLHVGLGVALWAWAASWPVVLLAAYTVGALFSWQCAAISHEGAHKLVFKSATLNKLVAVVGFLPVFLGPFGNFWSVEHMYHHQVVVDKMNRFGSQQSGPLRKAFGALTFFFTVNAGFLFFSIIVAVQALATLPLYALGLAKTPVPTTFNLPPYRTFPQIVNTWFFFNTALSFAFNIALTIACGGSIVPAAYLILSSGFSGGLHPLGMRHVQEHYLQRPDQPTYSVYSPFSAILLNIGYHVEHHDFPRVPWNRLPLISKIAPEFYKDLHSYPSYMHVLYTFLFDKGVPLSALLEDFQDVLMTTPASEIGRTKKTK